MKTRPPRPFPIVAENPLTVDQARAMVLAAAPQIAALLDAFERQEATDVGDAGDRVRVGAAHPAGTPVVAAG